ncbi:DinB family protein [Dermacoccaceae bacterium W4C1]
MMLSPAIRTEQDEILAYIDEQISALRATATGLSEEQARQTPTASALSIAGLLKHVTQVVFPGAQEMLDNPSGEFTEEEFLAKTPIFMGSFALTEDETLTGALQAYDAGAEGYRAALRRLDPGATVMAKPQRWIGETEPKPIHARFYLLHQIEELARHAGHADIIREQLDGATAFDLLADTSFTAS